ncbi:hypothetical protein LEQ03_04845 [Riemerella anatipestifer]|nr:hypothetical protein LEQ05_10800 [Riemerella anatipestifer]WPC13943.1 hypothetical protein LEQ03_04845 [Riemerella anatipestifer]
MKNLLLILGLGIFTMCTPQKRKVMKQEVSNQQEQEERLFYSEASGGEEKRGFRLINSQEELNRVLSVNQFVVLNPNEEKNREPKLIFPKNQQVILYHLGTFRAGMHKPQGIDSVKLVGDTLEVYMKKISLLRFQKHLLENQKCKCRSLPHRGWFFQFLKI